MFVTDTQIHTLVMTVLFPGLVVFTGVVTYYLGIRPILRQNPAFGHLYATEDTMINAIRLKLSGVKQRLSTVIISAIGFIVVAHDTIADIMTQAGFDPVAIGQQILPKIPTWGWPLITLAAIWLVQHFRNIADKHARANAEALLDAGHPLVAPAPGLPVSTLPSPAPFADKKD